jgi:hypothetical protein
LLRANGKKLSDIVRFVAVLDVKPLGLDDINVGIIGGRLLYAGREDEIRVNPVRSPPLKGVVITSSVTIPKEEFFLAV